MASKLNEVRKILGLRPSQDLAKVIITPDMARQLVAYNTKNRTRSKQREREYTADMREGKFGMSADMITFNQVGELTNGQGRLYSCIEADTPFETVVYLDLDQNIHMDTGRTRTTVDNIQLSNALDGICNDKSDTIRTVKALLRVGRGVGRVRDEEVLDFCKKHGTIIDQATDLGLLNLHGNKVDLFKVEIAAAFLVAAINGANMSDLAHVRKILTYADSLDPRDTTIRTMREKLFTFHGNQSGSVRKQVYYGMQYTINCYVNKKQNVTLQLSNEYYPLF